VAVDGRGNLFVVDRGNSQVRRFTIDGPISTVAGTGESGFSGDGGAATKAKLSDPMGLAVDRNGNLWIAEVGRVRRIDADGIITTVAGGGTKEPADGLSATSVRLRLPHSLAVDDAGNLYVAEQRRPRVYKVNPKGLITVVAGTGESGFSGDGGPATKARLKVPYALTVDRAGNLYIAEAGLNRTVLLDGTPVLAEGGRVRRVSPDGTITTVVGGGAGVLMLGGPAVPAAIDPRGLAIDTAGNLLIAIIGSRIVKVAGVAAPGLLPKKAEPAESADSGDPNATETGERSQAPTEERR
jgi:sugar lactone lactonase YvrE